MDAKKILKSLMDARQVEPFITWAANVRGTSMGPPIVQRAYKRLDKGKKMTRHQKEVMLPLAEEYLQSSQRNSPNGHAKVVIPAGELSEQELNRPSTIGW